MKILRALLSYLLLLFSLPNASAQSDLIFRDGDKINFIGNSITHGGQFHNYIQLYYATRFPERKLTFYNSGIWGDNANSFLQRMQEDILNKKTTWAIVMAGMNDVRRHLYAPSRQSEPDIETQKQRALSDYEGYYEQVIQQLQKAGAAVVLQKPSIYDQTAQLSSENMFGVNDALRKCTVIIDTLAAKYNCKVVDYFSLMYQLNMTLQQKDPAASIIGYDRIHPGAPGNFIMAYQFLKDIKAPSIVSETQIEQGKLKIALNCKVTALHTGKDIIKFKSRANSLPFPVEDDASEALSWVPFMNDLNREIITLKSLPAGKYVVSIDGQSIGSFTSKDLDAGVNLASVQLTPQYQQALKVQQQCVGYRKIYRQLRDLRLVEINYLPKKLWQADFSDQEKYIVILRDSNDPVYQDNKARFDNFMKNKPLQAQWEQQLAYISDYIYIINKPTEHTYIIRKL